MHKMAANFLNIKINAFFMLILLISCQKKEENVSDDTAIKKNDTKNRVEAIQLKKEDFEKQIISNGIVQSSERSEIHFKINERIKYIGVRNGQKVTKGQILASLDNDLLYNQVKRFEIEFDKAKIRYQQERINYNVDSTSYESNADLVNKLKMRSGYIEAKNSLENARILYNQHSITAPFDGIVGNINNHVGDYITSNEIFCSIVSPKKLLVSFSILESELPFVQNNPKVKVTPFFDKQKSFSAEINEINPLVSENGFINVKAVINTTDKNLLDGLHVKVIISQLFKDLILIPKSALVIRSNREIVFGVKDGHAQWNYVDIFDENIDYYAIKNGLKVGDTIIVSGNINLSHDAKVKVKFVNSKDFIAQ